MRRLSERGKPQGFETVPGTRAVLRYVPARPPLVGDRSIKTGGGYIPSLRACLRTVAIAPARTLLDAAPLLRFATKHLSSDRMLTHDEFSTLLRFAAAAENAVANSGIPCDETGRLA
jgi:hypothetical protein